MKEISGLPEDAEGAVLVRFPPGMELLGQVLRSRGDLTMTLLKDTKLETRLAYSLPVRLTPDLNTRLKVFNPGDKPETCAFS